MENSVSVIIPTPFREFTNGNSEVAVEGTTVNEALTNLSESYPEVEDNLRDNDGSLKDFVNVYRNDEDIRQIEALETELQEGDELSIIPAIAGGNALRSACK